MRGCVVGWAGCHVQLVLFVGTHRCDRKWLIKCLERGLKKQPIYRRAWSFMAGRRCSTGKLQIYSMQMMLTINDVGGHWLTGSES
jgi:hypothetical protein